MRDLSSTNGSIWMVTSLRALGFLSPIRLDVCVEFHSVVCLLVPVRLLQSKDVTLHIRPGFWVNTAVLSRMQITPVCLFLLLLWFPFSKVALCHWTTNPIFPEASWEANSTSGIISSPTRCTTYVTIAPHHLPHYHILSDLSSGLKLTPPHPLWKSILRSASSRWRVLQARTNGGNLGTEEREAESGCHQEEKGMLGRERTRVAGEGLMTWWRRHAGSPDGNPPLCEPLGETEARARFSVIPASLRRFFPLSWFLLSHSISRLSILSPLSSRFLLCVSCIGATFFICLCKARCLYYNLIIPSSTCAHMAFSFSQAEF